jgi:hypothetical protein
MWSDPRILYNVVVCAKTKYQLARKDNAMHNSQTNDNNTINEIPLGVRMPWYVALLNVFVSFLAVIDVVILSGFARLFCDDVPVLPGIVSLVFLWTGVKLCIKIWRGSVSAHVAICIMTFFSVLWFAADVPSREYWGEVGKWSIIFFLNCLSIFLICKIPSSAKWLRFRRDWAVYMGQNPSKKRKP